MASILGVVTLNHAFAATGDIQQPSCQSPNYSLRNHNNGHAFAATGDIQQPSCESPTIHDALRWCLGVPLAK